MKAKHILLTLSFILVVFITLSFNRVMNSKCNDDVKNETKLNEIELVQPSIEVEAKTFHSRVKHIEKKNVELVIENSSNYQNIPSLFELSNQLGVPMVELKENTDLDSMYEDIIQNPLN